MAHCWEGCLQLRKGRNEKLRCFIGKENTSRKEICCGLDQRKSLEYRNSQARRALGPPQGRLLTVLVVEEASYLSNEKQYREYKHGKQYRCEEYPQLDKQYQGDKYCRHCKQYLYE